MAAPFLVKRRAGWYLRIRIPSALRSVFGTHLTRSLKTRDYGVARRRAVLAAARLQACWQEAERAMTKPSETPNSFLSAEDFIRADRRRVRAEIAALSQSVRNRLSSGIDAALQSCPGEDRLSATPTDGTALAVARLNGKVEGMKEAFALWGARSTPPVHVDPTPDLGARDESAAPWPQLIDRFFAARPSIGDSAKTSHRQAFGEFEGLIGAKEIGSVTKADIARYVEWLESKANGRGGRERLARDTIVKLLQHVRGFFAWAEEKAYIAANPATGVRPRTETREERDAEDGRRAFTETELEALFDSPLFTGCAGRRSRAKAGSLVLRDERYWFFLVAHLTGARVEELSAAPSTLEYVGDIACLNLREAGTKTGNSPRLVPLVLELKRLGFVDWAEGRQRSGAATLFAGGSASADWSKWTNRYLDLIGLDDGSTSTYSLRHNFRQMLRAANLGDELMNKVFGHAHGGRGQSNTGAGYGRALSVQEARLVVECVRSPVCLTHLMIAGSR